MQNLFEDIRKHVNANPFELPELDPEQISSETSKRDTKPKRPKELDDEIPFRLSQRDQGTGTGSLDRPDPLMGSGDFDFDDSSTD